MMRPLETFQSRWLKSPQSPFTKGGRKWVLPFGKGELEGILSEVLTQLGYHRMIQGKRPFLSVDRVRKCLWVEVKFWVRHD
jgi:hypothetical protein